MNNRESISCPHCESDRVSVMRYIAMCFCHCRDCGKRWTELQPPRRAMTVDGHTDWRRGVSNDGVTPLTGGVWRSVW